MALVGSLAVNLTARTAQFSKGLSGASKKVGRFASGIGGSISKITRFGGALAGLVGVGGMGALVKSSMSTIDSVAKLSDVLNISTEGLASFRFAAGIAGASTKDMDKGLSNFVRRLGEAKAGTGEAITGLKMLGLSAADLAGMDTGEAIKLVADRIGLLPTAADRAAAAYQLFGRSGAKLQNFLAMGSAGIEKLEADADKLGITFSRFDASRIEQANDSINRMGQVVKGVGNKIAIGLAPYIDLAANKLVEMATSGGGASDMIAAGMGFVAKGIAFAADVVDTLILGFEFLQSGVTKYIAIAISGFAALGKAIETVVNLVPGMDVSFSDTLSAVADSMHQLASKQFADAKEHLMKPPASAKVDAWFAKLNTDLDTARRKFEENAAAKAKLNKEMATAQAGVAELNKLESFGKSIFEQTRTPLEKFEAKMNELQDSFAAGFIDEETFTRAAKMISEKTIGDLETKDLKADTKPLKGVSAKLKGTAEAFSAVQAAIRGGETPEKRAEKLNQQQLTVQGRMETLLKEIRNKTGETKIANLGPQTR